MTPWIILAVVVVAAFLMIAFCGRVMLILNGMVEERDELIRDLADEVAILREKPHLASSAKKSDEGAPS